MVHERKQLKAHECTRNDRNGIPPKGETQLWKRRNKSLPSSSQIYGRNRNFTWPGMGCKALMSSWQRTEVWSNTLCSINAGNSGRNKQLNRLGHKTWWSTSVHRMVKRSLFTPKQIWRRGMNQYKKWIKMSFQPPQHSNQLPHATLPKNPQQEHSGHMNPPLKAASQVLTKTIPNISELHATRQKSPHTIVVYHPTDCEYRYCMLDDSHLQYLGCDHECGHKCDCCLKWMQFFCLSLYMNIVCLMFVIFYIVMVTVVCFLVWMHICLPLNLNVYITNFSFIMKVTNVSSASQTVLCE